MTLQTRLQKYQDNISSNAQVDGDYEGIIIENNKSDLLITNVIWLGDNINIHRNQLFMLCSKIQTPVNVIKQSFTKNFPFIFVLNPDANFVIDVGVREALQIVERFPNAQVYFTYKNSLINKHGDIIRPSNYSEEEFKDIEKWFYGSQSEGQFIFQDLKKEV
jgi:hypothetical protein